MISKHSTYIVYIDKLFYKTQWILKGNLINYSQTIWLQFFKIKELAPCQYTMHDSHLVPHPPSNTETKRISLNASETHMR